MALTNRRIRAMIDDHLGPSGTGSPVIKTDSIVEMTPGQGVEIGFATRDVVVPVNPMTLRVWDAVQTNLPATAATDDLALITGTFGTKGPTIQGADFGGGTITQRARFQLHVPTDYVQGGDITIEINAGMLTTIADDAATVDLEVFRFGLTPDVVETAAISINDLTFGNKVFVLDETAISPGDILDCRVTITATDAGNLGVMIPEIAFMNLIYAGPNVNES